MRASPRACCRRSCDVYASKGVELRGCERSRAIVPAMQPATEADWYAEYLAPILAIRVVDSLDEAIAHIAKYGSQHTDAIVTQDHANAMRFLREVDSSSVMVNASPRFADGFEYGLGAEIGISTNKLHARGPVGLEGLTSRKWIVLGSGQIRTLEGRTMKATWNGALLAASDATIVVEGNHYFPPDSVRREHFRDSATHTRLPVEGARELLRRRRRRRGQSRRRVVLPGAQGRGQARSPATSRSGKA